MSVESAYKLLERAIGELKNEARRQPVGRPVEGVYPRMIEAIGYSAQGLTAKEIALAMGIAPCTVNHYLEEARVIMGAKNAANLVYLALRAGLID